MSDFLNKFTNDEYKNTIDKKDESPKKDKNKNKEKKQEKVEEPVRMQRKEYVEETHVDPNYKNQQRNKWILIIISSLVLLSLSIFGYFWINRVRVIDFVNQPVTDLQTWAARNDLVVQVEEVYSLDVNNGYVIEMTPVGGSTISKGDLINVVVSIGADPEENLVVPDFTNSTYSDIQAWIDSVKANNMRISYEYSDTIAAEQFIRIKYSDSNTTNNSYQRKDYAIVYISRGPQVYEKNIEVPNWIGNKDLLATVQSWATTNSVKLVVEYSYSALALNTVITQSAPAKSMVAKNDTITIVISKGLSVNVPDFSKMNMTDAASEVATLDAMENVTVDLIEMYNNTNGYGTYIWQDKDAGIKIDSSATKPFEMRVYYSLGKPYIDSKVGSSESTLTQYFYDFNLNSAELTYTVTYKNCTSVTSAVKGNICYQSKYNEYVTTGTNIDFIVHDPNATTTY